MNEESRTIEPGSNKVVELFPQAAKPRLGSVPGLFRPLPARMKGYTRWQKAGRHRVCWRTANYTDGSLAELQIDATGKPPLRPLLNAFGRMISLGRQHGVPLAVYVAEFMLPDTTAVMPETLDSPEQVAMVIAVIMGNLAEEYQIATASLQRG